jgi:hypothetical protein
MILTLERFVGQDQMDSQEAQENTLVASVV